MSRSWWVFGWVLLASQVALVGLDFWLIAHGACLGGALLVVNSYFGGKVVATMLAERLGWP